MAFLIPVIILAALYYVRDIFPFGSNCYLRSDMYHQYAPFFSEFWHKIRSGESLTYSWDIGMGTNFTSPVCLLSCKSCQLADCTVSAAFHD
ncbi:MAG: YfhO family protein [Lachnospira sp.]